jgi:hypothetical protein
VEVGGPGGPGPVESLFRAARRKASNQPSSQAAEYEMIMAVSGLTKLGNAVRNLILGDKAAPAASWHWPTKASCGARHSIAALTGGRPCPGSSKPNAVQAQLIRPPTPRQPNK